MATDSPLLQIPPEIRVFIYEHLLNTGSRHVIAIRNKPRQTTTSRQCHEKESVEQKRRRSSYYVLEKTLMRRSFHTTYSLDADKEIHPAIMAVSKKIREEAAHYLYAKHSFHFGSDLEAVAPFLADRTPSTRELVQDITLYKHSTPCSAETDSCDWAAACRTLKTLPRLNRLRIVVGGGRPQRDWEGPHELSLSDLRLLYGTRHESLEWVRELAEVKTVGQVEIVADVQYMAPPKTTTTMIFAALSASIETSLVEFMKKDLGIPATVGEQCLYSKEDRTLQVSQGGCVAS